MNEIDNEYLYEDIKPKDLDMKVKYSYPDLTNQTFGQWTVLKINIEESIKKDKIYWICKCSCGKIKNVDQYNLLNGSSTSCGCSRIKSLVGMRFGRLIVLELDREAGLKTGHAFWKCQCDCGKIITVSAAHLKSGSTRSCGCLVHNTTAKNKYNELILYDELGFGKAYLNNDKGFFLFDIEDLDVAKSACWHQTSEGYISTNTSNGTTRLHREIMKKYYNIDNKYVDHVAHMVYNNRKDNLRVCSQAENSKNRLTKMSSTGEKFIYYRKNRGIYEFAIKNEISRSFKTFEEAKSFKYEYIENNKKDDKYDYRPELDLRDRNIEEIIIPFVYTNGKPVKRNIIQPFYFV